MPQSQVFLECLENHLSINCQLFGLPRHLDGGMWLMQGSCTALVVGERLLLAAFSDISFGQVPAALLSMLAIPLQ